MENESQEELEWQEPIQIPDGRHTGKISKVEFRTEPYRYTDVYVKMDDSEFELKYGSPTILSENSKLGRLLMTFGVNYEKGKKSKPRDVLVGKEVEFMTINRKNKDGKTFARIIEDSLKPSTKEETISEN